MYKLPDGYIHAQADMLGRMFIWSARKGLDSDDFVGRFMTSKYGHEILTDERMSEWADAAFMLEGIMQRMRFKKGGCYDDDILWYAGYLYKYWISHKEDKPSYVYKLAPLKLIASKFEFYHTQGWEYVIEDLKDRYRRVGEYKG